MENIMRFTLWLSVLATLISVSEGVQSCAIGGRCPYGFECLNGNCERPTVLDRCARIRCGFEEECRNGRCVPMRGGHGSCAAVLCPVGTRCDRGNCVGARSERCRFNSECEHGWECRNRRCAPSLAIPACPVDCPPDCSCNGGRCACSGGGHGFRCTRDIDCFGTEECRRGSCVQRSSRCTRRLPCRRGRICEGHRCVRDHFQ